MDVDRTKYELRRGSLAYWDTLTAGLVPCKISWYVKQPPFGEIVARIVLTADRGGFRKGEVHIERLDRVVARNAVIQRRNCSTRILNVTTHQTEG